MHVYSHLKKKQNLPFIFSRFCRLFAYAVNISADLKFYKRDYNTWIFNLHRILQSISLQITPPSVLCFPKFLILLELP